ncbi:MAG: PIN domain-containing protein [Burkholderiales bacterium]
MRIFLDANVLFSAAYLDHSRTGAIFKLAEAGLCELISSAYALDEARRNLLRKHPERRAAFERLVARLATCGEPGAEFAEWAAGLEISAKDAPIIAAAALAGADWLVSGDRGFSPVYGKRLRGVEVMLPAEALARLLDTA